jgi:hypothetical protein
METPDDSPDAPRPELEPREKPAAEQESAAENELEPERPAVSADRRLRWAALAVNAGVAVAVVQALFVLLTIVQGLSLRAKADNFPSDVFHRIGIAFSTSVNIPNGLALVVAVFLVTVPSFMPASALAGSGGDGAERLRSRRVATLVIVDVVAAVIAAGTILGVRASLHADKVAPNGRVTPYQRWELAAYLGGTLGTALVAFLLSMAAMPARNS